MKQRKIKNYVSAEVSDEGIGKIYLYGDISDYFEDDVSARNVQRMLSEIKASEIEVHINSYGGDLFEGIAIYNLLKQHKAKIITVIDGLAASAASVIAMAGDEIKMPKNTQIMIHNPWTFAYGNATELRKIADDLEKAQSSLEQCYIDKFSGTEEELREVLAEEKFLTAEDAFIYGLCTEVMDKEPEQAEPENEELINKIVERVAAKMVTEEPEEPKENKILKLFSNFKETK